MAKKKMGLLGMALAAGAGYLIYKKFVKKDGSGSYPPSDSVVSAGSAAASGASKKAATKSATKAAQEAALRKATSWLK